MQKDLVDFLLTDLRSRPGMFLTSCNITYLSIYLTGVEVTCGHLEKCGKYVDRFSGKNRFVQWSWQKYGLKNRSYKLDHYLEFAKGNEKEALNLFFEDLEEYNIESNR